MSLKSKRKVNVSLQKEDSEDLFLSPPKKTKKSQSKKEDDELKDDSLFGELINKAGYILKKGDQPNLLKCDQAVFQKDLRWGIRSHSLYRMPEIAEKFVKGLEEHVDDEVRLKWALHYTQTVPDCVSARGGQQDSLIRLCLNIEELQPCLIKLLTEKLLEIAYDDENSNRVDFPCLILANLKWLDRVVDSDTLTAKIVDLIEGSPVKVQQEVISFVSNIVDDANHPKIAEVLCNLYDTTPELTPAILDALGHLTLAPDSLDDVRHSVLKSLQAARPEQLPVVVKFLLHNTPQAMAYQVVSDMREKINLPGDGAGTKKSPKKGNKRRDSSNEDDAAYEILLFTSIKMAALIYKFLTNAWLKAVQDVDDVHSVRTFDFLLLLVLYDAAPSRRRPIESIFRNKIRLGLFSQLMLEKTVTNHGVVLKEYFQSVKKMASLLLRSPEPVVSQAGASLYRYCFIHLDGYQKQEIVLTLLKHLGDSTVVRIAALSLLCSLAHDHTAEMSKFTIFLKGSLDMVDELSMVEVKKLLDVVSRLAFSDSSHAALQDELAIMVRKQLSHTDIKYKLIGVLNAVQAVKNMVETEDSRGSLETTSSTDLESSSTLKEAENLLHLVLSSTAKSPTASALFMDEMASIILKEGMNSKFEEWVCEKMTDDFQETFVLDATDSQPPCDLLPIEGFWNLDDVGEGGIIMNLAPMIIKAEPTRHDAGGNESKLVSLASQFRLLRMLESRLHDGDLGNVDALLGCPVYLPAEATYDKFTSLSQAEQHASLSCLFYTINWFRELINAFVTQKDSDIKSKVYQRLQQVIKLEKRLAQCLPACPSYSPPLAVFDLDKSASPPVVTLPTVKKAKKAKKPPGKKGKKGKAKENDGETHLGSQANSQPATQPTTQPTMLGDPDDKESAEKEISSVADMSSCRPFLRELHLDVFGLLFRKLALDTEIEGQGQLTLPEAEFLLKDLNMKLSHVFEAGSKRVSSLGNAGDKNIGHSHLDLFTPAEIAQRAHRFLKPICVHLEAISEFFQSLIADNDGIMDAPGMFSERTKPLIKVYSLLFTTLSVFLSWPGLQQEENSQILIIVLKTIGKKLEGEAVSGMGKEELVSVVFRYISNFHASVVSISTAVMLVQALVALTVLQHDGDLKEKLVEVLEQLLKREWYSTGGERERGTVYNHHVFSLLQIYLKESSNPLGLVDTICSEALEEFMSESGRDPRSETYPTLTKATLGMYYRSLLLYLVSGTKKALSAQGPASAANREECLNVWITAIKVFCTLVGTLKKYDTRNLLGPCLKYSRTFLELFLRNAMPLLDSCLRMHNQEVVTLLKNLQTSTRLLQHVCTHSKVNQDTSLTRYVPPMKKSLEMLVYRVKAMLAMNKCSSAFWMGNLKNRDLHGEELLSQSVREEEDTESEQAEGEGEEEEDEDVEDDQSDVELDEDEDNKSSCKSEPEEERTDYSVSF
ncbi:LOW QUALITY PROTEIN: Fanconi anemia group D2 protein-like [Penaeus monodon]|uniref:LOW QUALITY PROTEIN: Fanconi anemia group D2 protein-like n=1 Tax=Penaeus monodon TaxID=6687 RepID=UPI0018A72595|nr:LOW QUALITY PROTEIN: Fanconi anemia group D2 protein-like [Penaeus monodon]